MSSRSYGIRVAQESPSLGLFLHRRLLRVRWAPGVCGCGGLVPAGGLEGRCLEPWRMRSLCAHFFSASCRLPGPAPEPGSRLQHRTLTSCPTVPSGMLWALGCQLSQHDVCLVPGGTGPHVPHMPPGWDVSTEQLSWPPLLPSAAFPASLLFVFLRAPPAPDQEARRRGRFSVCGSATLSKAGPRALVSMKQTYIL